MRIPYAVVFVSDMARSVAFYRDTLGLPLRFETPGWSEFATDGSTLALHTGEGEPLPPRPTAPGQCRTGFSVPDIQAFHQRVTAAGVSCVQEPTETFGVLIGQYADPDGMVFSVSQETEQPR